MTKLSKNILKEASVLLIILLMFFSSTTAMVDLVDKQIPILMDDEHDFSLENEQKPESNMQTKLQPPWDFESIPHVPPTGWTQHIYSGTGIWSEEKYSNTIDPFHPYILDPFVPPGNLWYAEADSSQASQGTIFDVGPMHTSS